MLARIWDGVTAAQDGDAYLDYLRHTGVTECLATAGNRGVFVLRQREGARDRFRFVSLWDSMDSVRRFAGDQPERARYYPEDARYLLALEPGVDHYDVPVASGYPEDPEGVALSRELSLMWEGDAWHGPALKDVLEDIDVEQAAARWMAKGHTIWEILLHVTAWTDVFHRRLEGQEVAEPEEGDFPPVRQSTSAAWADARARLRAAHTRLVQRVARLTAGELDAKVPGSEHSARFLAHGAIRHIVYHTGQIALLKKAGGA